MDAHEAARAIVEGCGLTHRQIEARAGRYGGWIGQTLARPRPGADLLADLARSCGYRLELVPMDGGDSIVIGDASDDARPMEDSDRISEARALMRRATALLDAME